MRHVAGAHAPEFLGVDVTMPQAKLLYLVSLRPDQPMSALVPVLGVGLPAVSGLVDRLALLGYLERREDPADRRYQLLSVTERGAAALDRMRELNTEAMQRLLAGLDASELEALRTSLVALDREVQRLYSGPEDGGPDQGGPGSDAAHHQSLHHQSLHHEPERTPA
jgi:DNA-binding MarR family transcriptional regulator